MSDGFEWWAPQIQQSISQGDILTNVPVAALIDPAVYLGPETLKGGRPGWKTSDTPIESKTPKRFHILGAVASTTGIVVSHSCDLDKPFNHRVLVAPVHLIETLPAAEGAKILEQSILSKMPLPEIPSIGTGFADLRLISSIPRKLVDDGVRIASMSDPALKRLHAQLARFILEREPPAAT